MARKHTNKTGARSAAVLKRVVSLRDKQEQSWAEIAKALEVSPRTVRRMYDELQGEGAHFESRIPGKGGRTRQAEEAADAE